MLANYYERYLDSRGDSASFVTLGAADARRAGKTDVVVFMNVVTPQWRCSKSEGGYRLGVWEAVVLLCWGRRAEGERSPFGRASWNLRLRKDEVG